ncbi:MAG: protein phosphatase 2C domain-containing protein [Meiothermus sp.]|nr:protein phosphatase 2C domain-containing protein [Meiothermus sp.]
MRLARLDIATESNIGRRRRNNEDFHRVAIYPTPSGNLVLLAVADGMGGNEAGELASKLAIEGISEAARSYAEHLSSGRAGVGLASLMDKAFKFAQKRIEQEGQKFPERKGMGTTLTAVLLTEWNRQGVVGHIGDTRAYRYSSGRWTQLTQDHSWVAMQVRQGVMTADQAESHPWKNMLTQALGLTDTRFDVIPVSFAPGEVLIIATDGLYGLVPPGEWNVQGDLQSALDDGLAKALVRGGTDNITAIAARFK